MSLCFVLVGSQIKRFRTVLRALAAIGSELLVEGVPERLVLRAINSARSAFLAVSLSANFFESYNVFAQSGLVQAGVLIKHVLATFRSPRVSSMSCELNAEECVLKVNLKCDNGLLKRYGLDVTASDILQANLDGQDLPVTVVAQSAELNKLLNTFQSTLDEVTIIALPEQQADGSNGPAAVQRCVKIQSFYDPCKGASGRSLHTALSLDSHSSSVFKAYAHSGAGPCDVTINLKDFKALVGLCVELGADVQLRFGDAGMPLLAVPHVPGVQEMDYTAELILATLQESQVPPDDAAWNPQAAAAAGGAAAAANAQAAAGGGRAAADGAETIAGATTTAGAGGPGLTTAAGGTAAGGGGGDVTPQGGMHSTNNQFIRFNNAPAGGAAQQQQQQQQQRRSSAAAGAGMAAGSGGGGGGASGSSRRSGLNRLQRLEQQLEEAEADQAAAVAPYSRLASSFGQQASGAAGASGGNAAAGNQAAVSSRGGAGGGSPAAPGWQQQQRQQQQPGAAQFAAAAGGTTPAGGRAGDSQAGDPEELPVGGVYSRQQQQQQQQLDQQPDPVQQQWLANAGQQQQQQQQFVDMQVGDECDDEFPLTPEHEMQDDDWQ